MLVLSRYIGESITLILEDGQIIKVNLLNIKESRNYPSALIGIDADRSIKILRDELLGDDDLSQ